MFFLLYFPNTSVVKLFSLLVDNFKFYHIFWNFFGSYNFVLVMVYVYQC